MTTKQKPVVQCKTCPWRVGINNARDIPGYCRTKHDNLADTVRSGTESISSTLRLMACHKSKSGADIPCAGWMSNQLGDGNNIGLRMAVMMGKLPPPKIDGPQHETFEDTK